MAGQAPRIDTIETKINSQNTFLVKSISATYTTSTTNILPVTNVPQGLYKVTFGCRFFQCPDGATVAAVAKLNGATLTGENFPNGAFVGRITNFTGDGSRGYGITTVVIANFPNATNSFHLDITISGPNSPLLQDPFYILEKLDPYTQITTEWD